MKLKLTTAALCLMPLLSHANSNNEFSYFGLALQNNNYDINFIPSIEQGSFAPLNYSDEQSGKGFRGFYGYQFNQYFAVEVGLGLPGEANFNIYRDTVNNKNEPTKETVYEGDFKTLSFDTRIIATYPITGSFFLRAHAGAYVWDNDFSYLQESAESYSVVEKSDTGVSLLTGFGVGYGFNDNVAATIDYEKTDIADISTQTIVASLVFRF
ncbi:outer membrane beta-barrel protein [Pseudoalteromonas sp. N1230-9]|uniref:outer membrane beta-barrel protein n=1 Tax=Pseudoalteromonas sp. N1230-9 TaxID=2907156 RepID=UPI002B286B21|nr:outer membrane beta-barrel protein [Pseudoalteromonas sp. N1230-9]